MSRIDADERLHAVIDRHGAALARLAASYTRGSSEREDLFQEIVIAIWKALPRFRHECSERTFVFRIAHNRGIGYLSRRRVSTVQTPESFDAASPGLNPEQALSRAEERQRLVEAVHRLPLAYRQVVTLALEGLDYGEIGAVLGIRESNVGARLTRARQMLREML